MSPRSSPTRPMNSAARWPTAAGYGLLGKPAPAFVVAPVLTVTKGNVAEGWQESLHRDAPQVGARRGEVSAGRRMAGHAVDDREPRPSGAALARRAAPRLRRRELSRFVIYVGFLVIFAAFADPPAR